MRGLRRLSLSNRARLKRGRKPKPNVRCVASATEAGSNRSCLDACGTAILGSSISTADKKARLPAGRLSLKFLFPRAGPSHP
jgi:hypothetical protein